MIENAAYATRWKRIVWARVWNVAMNRALAVCVCVCPSQKWMRHLVSLSRRQRSFVPFISVEISILSIQRVVNERSKWRSLYVHVFVIVFMCVFGGICCKSELENMIREGKLRVNRNKQISPSHITNKQQQPAATMAAASATTTRK